MNKAEEDAAKDFVAARLALRDALKEKQAAFDRAKESEEKLRTFLAAAPPDGVRNQNLGWSQKGACIDTAVEWSNRKNALESEEIKVKKAQDEEEAATNALIKVCKRRE
jgi:hypothetical protein